MRNQIDKAWAGHPSEEWSSVDQHKKEMEDFLEMMELEKPRMEDYEDEDEFKKEKAAWQIKLSISAPTPPEIYSVNND